MSVNYRYKCTGTKAKDMTNEAAKLQNGVDEKSGMSPKEELQIQYTSRKIINGRAEFQGNAIGLKDGAEQAQR